VKTAHQLYAAPEDDAPALHHADALYRDKEGLLWVGTLGEGLRLVDGNRTFSFRSSTDCSTT
jgi:hypothetical protein